MLCRDGVLILYNLPRPRGGAAMLPGGESDFSVMDEVQAVSAVLERHGIAFRSVGIGTLKDLPDALATGRERVAFNLVEDLAGGVADYCFVPAVCGAMGRACTGNGAACQALCIDKWQTKAALGARGVPVPEAVVVPLGQDPAGYVFPKGRVIVKPLSSDASEGIDASSVVASLRRRLVEARVRRVHRGVGQGALVEQFIEGREINVSLLQRGREVEALPLAEIDFSLFPADKPRIVDYAAKWHDGSFEYINTPRKIPATLPERVAQRIRAYARAAWDAVGCQDYARVDLRLDENDNPYVLEVNPNPDISHDAGFAAALNAAKITYERFVLTVLEEAEARGGAPRAGAAGGRARKKTACRIRWSEAADRDVILRFMRETGFFRPDEMDTAVEVLDESLAKGPEGHYQSYTAEVRGRLAGWLCFGPAACTLGTFDVYWVVTAPGCQGRGVGSALMDLAEAEIRKRGGRLAVAETAGRVQYEPTREFYRRRGYTASSRIKDYYAPGDDKVVFTKALA